MACPETGEVSTTNATTSRAKVIIAAFSDGTR